MQNEPSETQAETERYLRDRVEELEITLEAMRAELRVAQQELWKKRTTMRPVIVLWDDAYSEDEWMSIEQYSPKPETRTFLSATWFLITTVTFTSLLQLTKTAVTAVASWQSLTT